MRKIHTRTTLNTGAGNDSIYLGSNATLGGLNQADSNTNGDLNWINAPLTVNGQGAGDSDLPDAGRQRRRATRATAR